MNRAQRRAAPAEAQLKSRFYRWAEARLKSRLNTDSAIGERMLNAIRDGLGYIVVDAASPPSVGTRERVQWERSCDRCDRSTVGEDVLSAGNPFDLRGVNLTVLLHAGLCLDCAAALGLNTANAPRSSGPAAPGLTEDLNRDLGGAQNFWTVIGESFEHREHAVNLLAEGGDSQ